MGILTRIETLNIEDLKQNYFSSEPFNHLVIDNFLSEDIIEKIAKEFPDFEEEFWYSYDNPLESKKASNNWNNFNNFTYSYFLKVLSSEFTSLLENITGCKLYPDIGLHGGGLHTHKKGGRLNPHLDYSVHPKLDLQRKLNLILYVNPLWKPEYGGHLGLWKSDSNGDPIALEKEIECVFNRAVIFDTSQNSWHGLSTDVVPPEGITRNSLAVYYLTDKPEDCDPRMKVKYAPREDQKDDPKILDLILKRQSITEFDKTYIIKK